MIQRKQTLFLLELVFLSVSLLFVPSNVLLTREAAINVYLLPGNGAFVPSTQHYLASAINLVCLLLAIVTIFLYKKRTLQVKLCYLMMVLWAVNALLIAFSPLAIFVEGVTGIENNYFGVVIGIFAIMALFLAVRFIKKDIDLLKSADRIR
ncbi:MAG: DUF4293 domain-containing protein [Bacteroidota bacterium]